MNQGFMKQKNTRSPSMTAVCHIIHYSSCSCIGCLSVLWCISTVLFPDAGGLLARGELHQPPGDEGGHAGLRQHEARGRGPGGQHRQHHHHADRRPGRRPRGHPHRLQQGPGGGQGPGPVQGEAGGRPPGQCHKENNARKTRTETYLLTIRSHFTECWLWRLFTFADRICW